MTEKQEELANLMSEISEECYCAGWMHGLEFSLWSIVTDPSKRRYGQSEVSMEQVRRLATLATEIDGWIYFYESPDEPPEEWGETYVKMDDWLLMYHRHVA